MTEQHLWAAAALCAALALAALYNFLRRLRRDRLVADTPLVRIRSAAQGYVKIAGRALPGDNGVIAAPMSARECVWWRYEISEETEDSRGNRSWSSVDRGESIETFALSDGDAACLVGPIKAEISPTVHDVWYGSTVRPLGPPPAKQPLQRAGNFRYTESLLRPGDRLSVVGELRSHSEFRNGSAAVAETLKHWKQDQHGLIARFDRNHDGRIDAEEWEAARAAAARETEQASLRAPIERTSVVSEPTNGEPFIIAPLSGDEIVRREQHFAALFLALGLLCVTLCGWAIVEARLLGR